MFKNTISCICKLAGSKTQYGNFLMIEFIDMDEHGFYCMEIIITISWKKSYIMNLFKELIALAVTVILIINIWWILRIWFDNYT